MRIILVLLILVFASDAFGMMPSVAHNVGSIGCPSDATLVFEDSFESPWEPGVDTGNWTTVNSNTEIESTIVKYGAQSQKSNASGEYSLKSGLTTTSEFWFDAWIYPDDLSAYFYMMNVGDSSNYVRVRIATDGSVLIYNDSTSVADTGVNISADQWYHIFAHVILTTDGSETAEVAVNQQVSFDSWDVSISNATFTVTTPDRFLLGLTYVGGGGTPVVYTDKGRIFSGGNMPCAWK